MNEENKNYWTILNNEVNNRLRSEPFTLNLGPILTRMYDIDLKFMHAVTYELNMQSKSVITF